MRIKINFNLVLDKTNVIVSDKCGREKIYSASAVLNILNKFKQKLKKFKLSV